MLKIVAVLEWQTILVVKLNRDLLPLDLTWEEGQEPGLEEVLLYCLNNYMDHTHHAVLVEQAFLIEVVTGVQLVACQLISVK